MFDIWCLHIPASNRTAFTGISSIPFYQLWPDYFCLILFTHIECFRSFFSSLNALDLLAMVETTVKSEYQRSHGKPIYLVGESLGACIALAVAACNPDIDLVLILSNPGDINVVLLYGYY